MPSPKEKPKGAKTKKNVGKAAARSQPAISAKQAAKLLKDKYVQQLDQRPPESSSAEVQAVDQVERAGSWAVDELLTHERPRSGRQPDQRIKEQPRPDRPPDQQIKERPKDIPEAGAPVDAPASVPEGKSPPPRQTSASPRQRPGPSPKERAAQVKGQRTPAPPEKHSAPAAPAAPKERAAQVNGPRTPAAPVEQHSGPAVPPADAHTTRIKERPAVRLKEQRTRAAAPSIKEKPSSLANQSIPSIRSAQSIPSSPKRPAPPTTGRSTTPAASQPGVGPNAVQPRREAQRRMLGKSRHSFSRQPGDAAPPQSSRCRPLRPRRRTEDTPAQRNGQ